MSIYILGTLFIAQLLILFIINKHHPEYYYKGFEQPDVCIFKAYVAAEIRHKLLPFGKLKVPYACQGTLMQIEYKEFNRTMKRYFDTKLFPIFKRNFTFWFIITAQLYWIYFVILYILSRRHKRSIQDTYIRGKVFADEKRYSKFLEEHNKGFKIVLNDKIFIPNSFTTKHHFIIGATGSGKSQFADKIIRAILNDNKKCIIHDYKGDMIPAFYDAKKHYIFNPLDVRHMGFDDPNCKYKGWTIFNELKTFPDVEAIAASLIAENKSGDPIWHTAPRDLLKAMMLYCMANGMTTNKELYDLILESPEQMKGRMQTLPEGRIALKHLEDPKLSGQFNSIIATFTAPLQYLSGTDGNFSIEKWIEDPNPDKKVLFLANQAKVRDTLKTIITTFFDFSIKSLCTLPDDPDRRLYFILDEFGRLGKMDSIIELLTQGRSKGASSWIFCQDLAQIENIYSKDLAKTIINGCRNRYYFNVTCSQTAEFISKEIGTVEFNRSKESKSFGVSDLKDSISINNEIIEKPIALPSQITTLKSLTFYMQLSDISEITQTSIKYQIFPKNCEAFIVKDLRVRRNSAGSGTSVAPSEVAFDSIYNQSVKEKKSLFSKMTTLQDELEAEGVPVPDAEKPDFSGIKYNVGVELINQSSESTPN
jgi:type IV secretory pathway TraG/TraD family ATPase VirD4